MDCQVDQSHQGKMNPEGCKESTDNNDRGSGSFTSVLGPAIIQLKAGSTGRCITDLTGTYDGETAH